VIREMKLPGTEEDAANALAGLTDVLRKAKLNLLTARRRC
jgi:hypothetical protein